MSNGPSMEPPERLESWKEIAAYLRKGVTTVQRWEAELGLPVRRRGKGLGVFAYRSEIDAWQRGASAPSADSRPPSSFASLRKRSVVLGVAAAATVGVVLAGFITDTPSNLAASRELGAPPISTLVRESGFARYPTFSPDGRRIAFALDPGEGVPALFVKELPNGVPRRITPPGLGVTGARWSPAGDWIAFAHAISESERDIMLIDPDGRETRILFRIDHGRLAGEYVGWTPDGASIVFAHQIEPGEPLRIERFDLAAGDRVVLTSPPAGSGGDYYPNVSPNGELLAFSRCAVDVRHCLPYVQELKTGRAWALSEDVASVRGMAWTPDSSAVAAARPIDGPQNLWLYRVIPGSPDRRPTRLTSHPERVYHPAPIPSAEPGIVEFAYERQSSDDNIWRLDVLDPESRPERIVQLIGHEKQAAVSRDGRRLAFAADASGHEEIWLADGDGSNPRQLTDFGKTFVGNASWTADGRSLLLYGPYSMRLYDVPTGRHRKLPGGAVWTSWAQDETAFYAAGEDDRGPGLFRFRFDGRTQRATMNGAFYGAPGPFGRYLYFTKGKETPLGLWRTPIGGGPEELVAPNVRGTEWTVVRDAVYYMEAAEGSGEIRDPIRFRRYRPAEGDDQLLRELTEDVTSVERGFSATWDGRWAYWSQRDSVQSDLLKVTIP